MKTWKLVSGIFTMLFSIFATFSGIVFGIDNAINNRADGGDSNVLVINMFFFMAGLVSICVRKSKIAGNIAIIILYGITALIGFSSGGSQGQWTVVAAWSTICAAIAAISLYKNIKKSKQPKNTSSSQANIATTTKQCPYCHADVPIGSAFCGSCGKELPKENICPQCGASVDTKAQFCPNCGKNLSEPIAADNVEQSVEYGEEEESPIKKYLPYILGAIALIAICGGGWWYYNSSKTTDSKNDIAATDTIAADTVAAAVEDVAFADTITPADTVACSDTEAIYEESYSSEDEVSHLDENTPSDDSNVCWFVFGTKKELERYNIIKGNSVNLNSIDNQYFSKINKNESKVIRLYSKSAKILTSHPQNSYELVTDENGNYQLNIISPLEFWSRSKYLVVENE